MFGKVSRLLLLMLLLVGMAGASLLLVQFGPAGEIFVDVPSGSGVLHTASLLEAAGIIRSRYLFDAVGLLKGGRVRAGEYRFDHPANVFGIYRRLERGDVFTRTLVIPEGYSLFDIARAVEAAGLGSAAEFLAAAKANTSLLARPPGEARSSSLEGFLYPDTYRFSRHTAPAAMLATMVRRFHQKTDSLHLGSDTFRVVTLASLVEKEVGTSTERPLVASVFTNRLARGMPLQTDPTVIYAALLAGRYRGTIYASDLRAESPYNTYRHAGLPPGPICSPGLQSLMAVLHPAATDFLYFVSDGAGHTAFSATLGEHSAHVAQLRHETAR